MKINTIEDLDKFSAEEIEQIRSSIDIRSYYNLGARKLGTKVGLTLQEYREWRAKEPDQVCRSCGGTGLFKPYERSVGTVHASSSHMCVRRLYYDVVADKAPKQFIPHALLMTFAIGHAIHDVVQKALHLSIPGFLDEVKIDLPELFVMGSSTDGLIPLSNCRVLLEIKSIGKEFDKLTAPKPAHIIQAMGIYANALDVPFISFLYVSKSWPHDIKEFVLTYDKKIEKRWWRTTGIKIEEALSTGQPPIATADRYECSSCPYNYFCEQRAR